VKYNTNCYIIPRQWITDRAALVCQHREIAWQDFAGGGRHPAVVACREVAYILCYEFTDATHRVCSGPELALSVGRANHSSIFTAIRRANQDPERVAEAERLAVVMGLRRRKDPARHDAPAREPGKQGRAGAA